MIAAHVDKEADVTVGCIELPIEQASAFGVMSVDSEWKIERFDEKPENPSPMPGNPSMALASMGIYVFDAKFLYNLLIEDADNKKSSHDFGKDVIPKLVENYNAKAYSFRDVQGGGTGYWRDVGTVDSFWQANLELIGVTPDLNLYDNEWPIWTYQEQLPPAKFVFDEDNRRGMAVDSMVSGGCIISGAVVRHSLLFSNVIVSEYSQIEDSVVLPDVTVGKNCKIKRAIIDKGCVIPDGMEIGVDPARDRDRFTVSPNGVILVVPEMLGQGIHNVR